MKPSHIFLTAALMIAALGSGSKVNAEFNNETLEGAIITFIKAVQNQDEETMNKLLHPDFGIVFLIMPGAYWMVSVDDKISFDSSWYLPLGAVTPSDYTVRFEALPEFDCDKLWSKPSGIYCQANYKTSLTGMAKNFIKALDLVVEEGYMEKLEYFESQSDHYHVIVLDEKAREDEFYAHNAYLDFVLTLINGKWYLTVIDVRGHCGA